MHDSRLWWYALFGGAPLIILDTRNVVLWSSNWALSITIVVKFNSNRFSSVCSRLRGRWSTSFQTTGSSSRIPYRLTFNLTVRKSSRCILAIAPLALSFFQGLRGSNYRFERFRRLPSSARRSSFAADLLEVILDRSDHPIERSSFVDFTKFCEERSSRTTTDKLLKRYSLLPPDIFNAPTTFSSHHRSRSWSTLGKSKSRGGGRFRGFSVLDDPVCFSFEFSRFTFLEERGSQYCGWCTDPHGARHARLSTDRSGCGWVLASVQSPLSFIKC